MEGKNTYQYPSHGLRDYQKTTSTMFGANTPPGASILPIKTPTSSLSGIGSILHDRRFYPLIICLSRSYRVADHASLVQNQSLDPGNILWQRCSARDPYCSLFLRNQASLGNCRNYRRSLDLRQRHPPRLLHALLLLVHRLFPASSSHPHYPTWLLLLRSKAWVAQTTPGVKQARRTSLCQEAPC